MRCDHAALPRAAEEEDEARWLEEIIFSSEVVKSRATSRFNMLDSGVHLSLRSTFRGIEGLFDVEVLRDVDGFAKKAARFVC